MDVAKKNTTEINMDVNHKRISWGAIIAGSLIMLVIMLLLSLFGLGVGIGSIKPASETQAMDGLGTGAIIWWVISNLIAVFVGGFVAGKLANIDFKGSGTWHGIISWSLYAMISFFVLTTTVGSLLNNVGDMISKSASALGGGIGNLVESGQGQELKNKLERSLEKSQIPLPDPAELKKVVQDIFFQDGKFNKDITQQEIETAIAKNTKYNQDQIRQLSDQLFQAYQKSKEEMQQRIEAANKNIAKAAIWSFIALLIGSILAALGGMVGGKRDDVDYIRDK